MPRLFPHALTPLPEATQKEVKRLFQGYRQGLVAVGPCGYLMPMHYQQFAPKYYNFKFRPDDVVVMTFPKCGTTWMQEITWTMRNNLDFQAAKTISLGTRAPFLEFDSLDPPHLVPYEEEVAHFQKVCPGKDYRVEGLNLGVTETIPSPRTIKTHLPFSLLNPDLLNTCKVIYVARNPKDVCVSYYHHQRLVKVTDYIGDFPTFVDYWCRDLMAQGPYFKHVGEGWSKKDHPNVLFIFYEDLKKDTLTELHRINTFLGTELSDAQLLQVKEHTTFSNMKANTAVNNTKKAIELGRFNEGEGEFVRKGDTGSWNSLITPELELKIDNWIEDGNTCNIPFQYKIKP